MKSICTCVIVIVSLSACVPDHGDPRTSGKSEGGTSEVKDSQRTQGPAKTASGGSNDGAANRLDPNTYDHFGDGITEGAQAVTLAVVAEDLDKHSGKKIRLTGKVSAV